jgi:hypothetical protein
MFICHCSVLTIPAALCVEWAKAKARADRWEEEVILLDEEMRRVLEFCRWKALWWTEQVPRRENLSAQLAEGLCAYAEEQANQEQRICMAWTTKWSSARALAHPILQAALGGSVAATQVAPILDPIELDIEEDHCHADDSDFEE